MVRVGLSRCRHSEECSGSERVGWEGLAGWTIAGNTCTASCEHTLLILCHSLYVYMDMKTCFSFDSSFEYPDSRYRSVP